MSCQHACIIIVLAALIQADGVLGSTGQADIEPLLSLPNFKLVVGLIAHVLAGAFLEESRK